jgi:hypothetical protein
MKQNKANEGWSGEDKSSIKEVYFKIIVGV